MRFTKQILRRKAEEQHGDQTQLLPVAWLSLGLNSDGHSVLILGFSEDEQIGRKDASERAAKYHCKAWETFPMFGKKEQLADKVMWWLADQGITAVEAKQIFLQVLQAIV